MAPDQPLQSDLTSLLAQGKILEFNELRADLHSVSLRDLDLCGMDLRNLDVRHLDLLDCHLRHADLRGLDFSNSRLDGTSISGAKISGTLFPSNLSAEEILLSLVHGTRMRALA